MVAGKVALTFDVDWIAEKPYDRLVAVRYNDNCYISKKESTGIEPTNEEYWFLAVKGGASVATTEKAGIVKPDGITIMIDEDGTIRSAGMTDIPIASSESLGGVIVGDGIEVDENGKISVPIDNSLSLESENAVQNKVVSEAISNINKTKDIIIFTDGWNENLQYACLEYKILDADVSEADVVSINLDIPSLDIASECGLKPVTVSSDGEVTIYADSIPSAEMTGTMIVQKVVA